MTQSKPVFAVVFSVLQFILTSCGAETQKPVPTSAEPSPNADAEGQESDTPSPFERPEQEGDADEQEDQSGNENEIGSFVLVSDLDDTLKITNVLDSTQKIINATFGKKVFAGMPQLVRALTPQGKNPFYLLSGSPTLLAGNVNSFLSTHSFPKPKEVILKDGLGIGGDSDLLAYKTGALRKIGQKEAESVVLIGDDTQDDPAAFKTYADESNGRVAAIYIHRVKGASLPAGMRSFTTAFEVAVWEWQANRLQESDVKSVGQALLQVTAKDSLIPSFVKCPASYQPLQGVDLGTELSSLYEKIRTKVEAFCR